MKEKNINIDPVQDQGQRIFSADSAKNDETPEQGSDNYDQSTDGYTDEYDSYSPWG